MYTILFIRQSNVSAFLFWRRRTILRGYKDVHALGLMVRSNFSKKPLTIEDA